MKKGIAFGGGGAKGYAHIGVLKALKEIKIEFDIVTGTSIGSFVGAVYAGGGIDKLEKISSKINITDLPKILSPAFSKRGLLSGNYINQLLKKVIKQEKIEQLPKKFAAIAVDINKGDTVEFTKGKLDKAIRASIAIPGLFTPVIDKQKFLVDGGVLEPVPVRTAKKLGADLVIAVDLISKYQEFSKELGTKGILNEMPLKTEFENLGDYIKRVGESFYLFEKNKEAFHDKTVIDIIQRISIITQSRLIQNEIIGADIVIKPDVSKIGILEFHKSKEGIKAGYDATKKLIPEINKVLKISK
ncbi:MAG: patatin-like phospholipase family protein [Thermodesulfobacteriota bacterium]